MDDAAGRDALDIPTGCTDSEHGVSGGQILRQLGPEQENQAHVHRGEVSHPQGSVGG